MAKKRKPSKQPRRTARRRLVLVLCGLALGFLSVWVVYLNHVITARFDGQRFAFPSRVYARPLELYPGASLGAGQLEFELQAAGYRRLAGAPEPATYAVQGTTYLIRRRGFLSPDGREPPRLLRLRLADGAVVALADARSREPLPIERLDPALIGRIYPTHGEDRRFVPLAQVPELLVSALIAVEDRDFATHHGLDFSAIARAAWANLRAGEVVQGGSTLTQQLVKNYFLTQDRTLVRKLNEAVMALLLEWHYDKAAILEAYLNEIYLGQDGAHAIHGIGRGAEFWFGRPVEELAVHQIALLVGMIQAPSLYDPRRHPERALTRRNRVLAILAEQGALPEAPALRASRQPLDVVPTAPSVAGRYPAFMDRVRYELQADYRDRDLRAAGLSIFTTLSPWAQHQARLAVSRLLPRIEAAAGQPEGSLQAALVLVSPNTGDVRAIVGSRKPGYAGFNRALDAHRPVGSLIKPFVYLSALSEPAEYTLASTLFDEPITIDSDTGRRWTPENFDGAYHGEVALIQALAYSYNVATVRLGMTVGVGNVLDTLHRLGLRREIPAYPSLLLGAQEFTPMEMAQLYQGIASGGHPVPLRAVEAVLNADGEPLTRYPLRLEGPVSPQAVYLLTRALQATASWGTAAAFGAALPGLGVAGKTGTSDGLRDSWFAGFTGSHLSLAWVGRDDYQPANITGASAALQLVAALLGAFPAAPLYRPPPEGVVPVWVSLKGPALADEDCPEAVQLPFIQGSAPEQAAPCLDRSATERLGDWVNDLFGG